MHTLQIADKVIEGYKQEKLTDERVDFLIAQANEQLEEIAKNEELYNRFIDKVKAPQKVDNIILWILFMSDEGICEEYIDRCKKDFREIIPISDLADLLLYAIYLHKVQNVTLDGFEFLVELEEAGIEEVDQYSFTNVLLYIQKSKEVQMEF